MLHRDTSILLEANDQRLAYPRALSKILYKANFDTGLQYKQKKLGRYCIGPTIYVLRVVKTLNTLSGPIMRSYSCI
jgi:hypothetical protein